jgi:hypothetical protein
MIWAHVNKCAKKAAEIEAKKNMDPKNHAATPSHGATHGMKYRIRLISASKNYIFLCRSNSSSQNHRL